MKYAADRSKAIAKRAAQNCENAAEPVCRCRCGGDLHGAKRGDVGLLPMDDPHSPAQVCPKCKGDGQDVYIGGGELVKFKCAKCGGTGRMMPKAGA